MISFSQLEMSEECALCPNRGESCAGDEYIIPPLLPPPLPPLLQRNTSAEIEAQLDQHLSIHYDTRLNAIEPFGSQPNLKLKHHYFLHPPANSAQEPLHMKQIMKEISELPKKLEISARGSMFVRFDDDSPQFIRAILTGVEGTPYASGVFIFDIFLPADYPVVPCLCTHVTPNANLVKANNGPGGFSPNLHKDTGKVCLSLLGTWAGPGWTVTSNLYQVLSSILFIILGAKHPYYMEPGHGGWEGTAPNNIDNDVNVLRVVQYDEEVKLFNARLCILAPIQQPPEGFESLVLAHLFEKRKVILATLNRWAAGGSMQFQSALTLVIADIQQAYHDRMTVQYAEEDCQESEQLVVFIHQKMEFLRREIERCELTVVGSAARIVPLIWEQHSLGPSLLTEAQNDLVARQNVLQMLLRSA